ncbi:MAG TPA: glycine dehydrogenase, partial [Bacillota bacterium]
LREIAARCFNNAHYLYERLINSGFTPLYPDKPFFMEFALRTPEGADYYINRLINTGILAGYDLSRSHPERDPAILICATEIFSREQLDEFVTAMEGCRHE